jgi:hypothetical protein
MLAPRALREFKNFALSESEETVAGRTSTVVGWPALRLPITRCRPMFPVPPITSTLLILDD